MHILFKGLYHLHSYLQIKVYKFVYGKRMLIGKRTSFRKCFSASVEKNAFLSIGENCFFNNNCIINAHKRIEIGDNTIFGPNVIIYDHDHDYKENMDSYLSSPIKIGKNCWIGGNVTILKGAIIGDDSVIAAGSIVFKEVPEHAIFIQKRKTTIVKKS